jgi:hypothetical protein
LLPKPQLEKKLQWFIPYMDAIKPLSELDRYLLPKLAFENVSLSDNGLEALLESIPKNMRHDVNDMYMRICLCGWSRSFTRFFFFLILQVLLIVLSGHIPIVNEHGQTVDELEPVTSFFGKMFLKPIFSFFIKHSY